MDSSLAHLQLQSLSYHRCVLRTYCDNLNTHGDRTLHLMKQSREYATSQLPLFRMGLAEISQAMLLPPAVDFGLPKVIQQGIKNKHSSPQKKCSQHSHANSFDGVVFCSCGCLLAP